MQYALIILVQDFCPLKIKITQCPGGFRLNVIFNVISWLNKEYKK